jgi:hypothetical protein
MLRYSLFLLGVILALPILAVLAVVLDLPITIWGIAYLFGSALAAAGLILFPWAGRNSIRLIVIDVLILALVASLRLILAQQDPNPNIRMILLPQDRGVRWINTLIDEQDSLVVGEALFHLIGGDSPGEHENIASALRADYSEMRRAQRIFASPLVNTYLNLQRANHFDAVIIDPKINQPPEFALIFLHGYM